jgi:hypothetical protein
MGAIFSMLQTRLIKGLALLAFVGLCAVRFCAAEEPREVAAKFIKAVLANNTRAIHELSVGTEDQFHVLEVLAKLAVAAEKFKVASDKKFGLGNVLSKGAPAPLAIMAEAEKTEFTVEGNVATEKGLTDHPTKLKRVGGAWKVDLDSMSEGVAEITAMGPKILESLTGITAEIEADKYHTAEEAQKAMETKFRTSNSKHL